MLRSNSREHDKLLVIMNHSVACVYVNEIVGNAKYLPGSVFEM